MTLDRRKQCFFRAFVFMSVYFIVKLAKCDDDEVEEDVMPSLRMVLNWSQTISQHITQDLDNELAYNFLKTNYINSGYNENYVSGPELLQTVGAKWEAMLQLKMAAVKRIVKSLEELYGNYTYNASLDLQNVEFYNSKNFSHVPVEYNELFLSNVNTNFSSVQIPTDIYEGDPEVLNSIVASGPIDEVYRENAAKDDQLIWQYFGSNTGFYRSYPAKEWDFSSTSTEFDQYDTRRRGWYIQATSSPKNIMILIDTSGSTYGMTLEIIKVSVSKALDTLGNDDYVMVASFNIEAKEVVPCFGTFVQANLRNKKRMRESVQNLEAYGQVDFGEALSFAFEKFLEFNTTENLHEKVNNQGANCIRAIMIFTDGGRDMAREVIEKYNRINGEPWVRIFVYNVGTDSMVPNDGVKDMACSNKGFFSNIRSFGAVRLTTLDYVPVLSRPMVLSGVKNFQWSDIYLDALGLGMMTTLTQPVYNRTKDGTKSEELLGVVGTDITTANMAETVPQRKPAYNSLFHDTIGPEGYAFGINTNGYILLHPRLKAELGYLSDPPNVDFLEVEFEDEKKLELRKDMIDGKTDSKTFLSHVASNDERYLESVEMKYSYTFINDTTFSVALAQPRFDLVQFQPKLSEAQERAAKTGLHPNNQLNELILIAPWLFCETLKGTEMTTKQIYDAIVSSSTNDSCDVEAIAKLLGDSLVTRNWSTKINLTQTTSNESNSVGVESVFVATQGGLTRYIPDNFLSKEEQVQRQDPWEQSYYRRPLYKEDTYIFSVPYNDGKGNNISLNTITTSKAILINKTNAPAVVGAILNATTFNSFWLSKTTTAENGQTGMYCYDVDTKPHCLLLDDGGFIIASSVDKHQTDVGRFFGMVDGRIMEQLVLKEVYKKQETLDYQAACPRMDAADNAGLRSFFVPTIADVISFNWWLTSAAWTFFRHTLYDIFVFGITENDFVASETVAVTENVSCIKLQTQFYFNKDIDRKNDHVTCSKHIQECDREWFAARVADTNLVLLSVNGVCSQAICDTVTISQIPREATEDQLSPCLNNGTNVPRYRKRPPEACYDFNKNESLRCSDGFSIHRRGPLFTIFVLILVVCRLLSS